MLMLRTLVFWGSSKYLLLLSIHLLSCAFACLCARGVVCLPALFVSRTPAVYATRLLTNSHTHSHPFDSRHVEACQCICTELKRNLYSASVLYSSLFHIFNVATGAALHWRPVRVLHSRALLRLGLVPVSEG